MRLVFCEMLAIERWIAKLVATAATRTIRREREPEILRVYNAIEGLRKSSLRPACTVSAAAAVVTFFYKRENELPFDSAQNGFIERKAFARTAHGLLLANATLVSPSSDHFREAQSLWYTYCVKGVKEAYAGFDDYVNAAMILRPHVGQRFEQVVTSHSHLPYILRKVSSNATIHHVE